jgi:hypothetical protein
VRKQIAVGIWNVAKGCIKQWYAALRQDDGVFENGRRDEFDGRIQLRLARERQLFERFLKCGRAVYRI